MKRRIKYKLILVLNFLGIIPLMGIKWYNETQIDHSAYKFLDETGIDVLRRFHYAYLFLYLICIVLYLFSLYKNLYIHLYLCDIALIFAYTIYPILCGKSLKFVGRHIIKFYAKGYVITILLLLINIILLYKTRNQKRLADI